jgi:hypothetical protein
MLMPSGVCKVPRQTDAWLLAIVGDRMAGRALWGFEVDGNGDGGGRLNLILAAAFH